MHEKYRQQTDIYFNAFQQQWQFIRDRQVDPEFGGVYDTIEHDGAVTDHTKARIWKEAYHDSRALLNVTERLQKLAGMEMKK
jgi:mannose/cellobiose epimerase-like protein (N-acyl-D-glucosamine 2-epimerase family)